MHKEDAQALMDFDYLFCWCLLFFLLKNYSDLTSGQRCALAQPNIFLFNFTPGQYLCEICFCSRYWTQNYIAAPGNALLLQWGRNRWGGCLYICRSPVAITVLCKVEWRQQGRVSSSSRQLSLGPPLASSTIWDATGHPKQSHRPGRCDPGPEGDRAPLQPQLDARQAALRYLKQCCMLQCGQLHHTENSSPSTGISCRVSWLCGLDICCCIESSDPHFRFRHLHISDWVWIWISLWFLCSARQKE